MLFSAHVLDVIKSLEGVLHRGTHAFQAGHSLLLLVEELTGLLVETVLDVLLHVVDFLGEVGRGRRQVGEGYLLV